jgi:hypothetical protein
MLVVVRCRGVSKSIVSILCTTSTYRIDHKPPQAALPRFDIADRPHSCTPNVPNTDRRRMVQHWWNLSIRFFAYIQMSLPQPLCTLYPMNAVFPHRESFVLASFYAEPSRPAASFCAFSCSMICFDQYLEGANRPGCCKTCQRDPQNYISTPESFRPSQCVPRASCICAPSPR